MEDKQLHLNRPLLSVRTRRPSSPAVSPKKDYQAKTDKSLSVPYQLPSYKSELKTGPISNPGTVPFTWEHIPGRPKEDSKPQTPTYDNPPVAPKFPPGRYPKPHQPDFHAISHESKGDTNNVEERVKNIDTKKETREELERSDSEDSDEAYVDALDTLSRAESYFINCSMSGLSGMDDLDLKPKGGFSSDLKTREFMMDRFLPAAKAMVSETPEPKKQLVVREEKRVNKVENQVYKPSLRYGPSFTNRYSHCVSDEEEEESDDDYAQSGSLPGVCGLLPRFCFKSSVYLLNPVPGSSVGTRVPISRATKRHGSSSSGSYSTTENELKPKTQIHPKHRMIVTELLITQKCIFHSIQVDKIRTAEFEDKASLSNESGLTQKASTDCYVPPQSIPDGKDLGTPEKRKHSGTNSFGSDGKGFKTFQEFLANPEEDSEDAIFEKTVYVDTIHKVESPKSRSSSSNVQKTERGDEDDHDINPKTIDQTHIKDSCLEESKKIVIAEQAAKIPSSSEQSNEKWGMEMQKDFGEYEDRNSTSTAMENNKYSNGSSQRKKLSEFLIPPPLPKSPSDSWLGRTLPSISTKSRSYYGTSTNPQSQFSKASTGNFKWETIVKSTNVQRQHIRYSEDVLAPIQET